MNVSLTCFLALFGLVVGKERQGAFATTNNMNDGNLSDPRSSPIPIVDISELYSSSGNEQRKHAVARKIGQACEEIGFFAITNHGVDSAVLENAWSITEEFFDLPYDEKMLVRSHGEEYPYGYEQSETLSLGKALEGGQKLEGFSAFETGAGPSACVDGNSERERLACEEKATAKNDVPPPDLKETFAIGPSDPDKSGLPARRFPARPVSMARAYKEYYAAMEVLTGALLRAFALALGLEEDWFEDKMDRHMCALRALNYPDLGDATPLPGQLRAGAHTDYGALTILRSGGPGLQVSKDGDVARWVDVPHLSDAFIINVGDLMQRWTNDKWVSTLHRVVVPPNDGLDHRRQSMAFFVNINGDAEVIPIETCVDANTGAKYDTILARDHLMSKHLASMREKLEVTEES